MSWTSRRRALYISVILLVFVVLAGWIGFRVFYTPPTCFDGERNGNEAGVDCGGSCERVCGFQAVDPIVLWSRFFERSAGDYSAAVLIENPNTNVQAPQVPYTLKLRDAQNVLVAEIHGAVDISTQRTIPIFIPGITTGERMPVRSTFTFDTQPTWEKVVTEKTRITVSNIALSDTTTGARLDVTVHNEDRAPVSDISLVAILSDVNGNAVAASQTTVSFLEIDEKVTVVFTWPRPLKDIVASVDVIPTFPLVP